MRGLLYFGVFVFGLLGTLSLLKSIEDALFGPGLRAGGFGFAAVCLVLAGSACVPHVPADGDPPWLRTRRRTPTDSARRPMLRRGAGDELTGHGATEPAMTRETILRRRIRVLLWLFIVGLVLSGLTAFPLETETRVLADWLGANDPAGSLSGLSTWVRAVRDALIETNRRYPFLAYGTDWLAFAHLVIAVAFIGPLRDPVRNVWVLTFGLIACAAVIPLALIAGPLRGIPLSWRLIDCSLGVVGFVPLWFARQAALELERLQAARRA